MVHSPALKIIYLRNDWWHVKMPVPISSAANQIPERFPECLELLPGTILCQLHTNRNDMLISRLRQWRPLYDTSSFFPCEENCCGHMCQMPQIKMVKLLQPLSCRHFWRGAPAQLAWWRNKHLSEITGIWGLFAHQNLVYHSFKCYYIKLHTQYKTLF